MRAVVFTSPGEISVTEVPDPSPEPRDVVIEVAAVGLCGTDIHVFEGDYLGGQFPIVPGHEATGTVVEVGSEVSRVAVGDRVAIDPILTCGECEYCVTGRNNLCRDWNSLGVIRSFGAAAELVVAPARNVHLLGSDDDLFQATMIEPLSCVIRGLDLQPRRIGDHYLVYGAGTMGLLMAQMAERAGAASVSIVDTNDARLATAAEVGLDLRGATPDVFGRTKWDVVIDCTGVVAAMEDAMTRVKPGGVFQQFGVAPVGATARYQPLQITKDEITILGSMAARHSFGRAVDMFRAGAVRTAPLFSHSFPLDGYAEAMSMFRSGFGRKLQIRPQDDKIREI